MAEFYPISKLKRKKPHVEQLELDKVKRSKPTLQTGNAQQSAAPWWIRQNLPAVEKLWAFTLQSALPRLETQLWDPVPDLPHPSAASSSCLKVEDPGWWDFSRDVSPLPDRQRSSPELLVQTLSRPASPEPQISDSQQLPSRKRWTENEEHHEEQGKAQKSPTRENQSEKASVSSKETSELQRRADGGVELKSCPMCLLEFPTGFTQMDCDSHLAQCLSDMNMDMNW